MTKREQILASIKSKEEQIYALQQEVMELEKENILLCDDKRWYKEEVEFHPKAKWQRKPNWLDGKLVGRIYWKQDFRDGDTDEVITIERSRMVRVEDQWFI